ncbi:NYN domain-containing protein [Rhodococcus baikonurensis]|uniref:NYN domain-containing protein n=1 Tax=Rhodococcus baikonurensis TaxID=172041 RepID=UPI0037BC3547
MIARQAVSLLPKQHMQSRRLVLVDIENAIGGAALHVDAVRWAKAHIEEIVELEAGDQVIIGTSHIGLLNVGCGWTSPRYVVGSGPDGADHALLAALDEAIESRFGDVVIVSGDGIFTEKAAALAARGIHITVVAHMDGLSKRLRMAAHRVNYFTTHHADNDALGCVA